MLADVTQEVFMDSEEMLRGQCKLLPMGAEKLDAEHANLVWQLWVGRWQDLCACWQDYLGRCQQGVPHAEHAELQTAGLTRPEHRAVDVDVKDV